MQGSAVVLLNQELHVPCVLGIGVRPRSISYRGGVVKQTCATSVSCVLRPATCVSLKFFRKPGARAWGFARLCLSLLALQWKVSRRTRKGSCIECSSASRLFGGCVLKQEKFTLGVGEVTLQGQEVISRLNIHLHVVLPTSTLGASLVVQEISQSPAAKIRR